jgi:hypothetical protein
MYQVSIGGKDAVYQYIRQPTFGRRIIILAQYCVSREPRTGSTETAILKGIEDNGYYDDDAVAWVDLVQLSSKTTNAVMIRMFSQKLAKIGHWLFITLNVYRSILKCITSHRFHLSISLESHRHLHSPLHRIWT